MEENEAGIQQVYYGEEAIANMIKTSMPMAMYTSLYDEENLEKIITKVRDIYARPHIKAQIAAEAAASASTAGVPSATPFNQMTDQYMYLQGMGTTSRNPSNLMSHPKEEAGVEAEVEEVEAGEEVEVQHKEVDSKEFAEDSLPSGELATERQY